MATSPTDVSTDASADHSDGARPWRSPFGTGIMAGRPRCKCSSRNCLPIAIHGNQRNESKCLTRSDKDKKRGRWSESMRAVHGRTGQDSDWRGDGNETRWGRLGRRPRAD